MKQNMNLTFRKGDLLAILTVALLAVVVFAAFLPGSRAAENGIVQIYRDAALIDELPLSTNARLGISGEYTNILVISGGKAFIEASDCPGGDCMHSGAISGPGRSIVCLPNRVEIRITGTADADVDFVVG